MCINYKTNYPYKTNYSMSRFMIIAIGLFFSPVSLYSKKAQPTFVPLKILFVEKCFPPQCSTAVLNQITGLIDLGHSIHIYSKSKGIIEQAHPDCISYNLFERTYWEQLPANLDSYDIIYCQFGEAGKELIDFLQDSVLVHAKIVTCFRGADVTSHQPEYYQKLFDQGTLFLPVCEHFKNKLIALGCNDQKIVVHRSGIDTHFFLLKKGALMPPPRSLDQTRDGHIKLISVCRITDKKGLLYSLQALAQLISTYPNLHYTIIGSGKRYDQTIKKIDALNITNNVTLLGYQTQDQIVKHLHSADIFILTSITPKDNNQEGIPNSLKEAMACGLPVISTYHAGIPELVEHNKSGLLVPEKDADAIAQQISYLIENKHVWPQLCRAARQEIVKNYEKKGVNKKLEQLFYNLCKSPAQLRAKRA
jgi:colanic acid/amylovoran biosynthesis glycosyltransferase